VQHQQEGLAEMKRKQTQRVIEEKAKSDRRKGKE
jgi:hypothetical protein